VIPSFEKNNDSLEIKQERAIYASPHIHEALEIIYVTDGTMELGTEADLFYLGKGDLALIFPSLIHHRKELSSDHCSCMTILAAPSFFGSYEEPLHLQRPINPVIKSTDIHSDVMYVLSALSEANTGNTPYTNKHQNSFNHVWIQVILSRCIPLMDLHPRESFRDFTLVSKVVAFVANHYRDHLTLQQVAKEVGVSRFVLSRAFSNDFHQNFNHYINSVRLEHATALLADSDEPIKNVPEACGFRSSVTFNRVFMETYHLTPRQYRQKYHVS
jgi:AraC-like DNA-binding protein